RGGARDRRRPGDQRRRQLRDDHPGAPFHGRLRIDPRSAPASGQRSRAAGRGLSAGRPADSRAHRRVPPVPHRRSDQGARCARPGSPRRGGSRRQIPVRPAHPGTGQLRPRHRPGPLSCRDLVRGEEEKKRREDRERAEVLDFYRLARQGTLQDVLGVDENAAQDQIKTAYLERKERYQPSRFMKNVQHDLREELQIIEARILESFLAVRSQKLGQARASGSSTERVVNLDLETLAMRKEMTKTEKQSVEEEKGRMAEQFFTKARDYFKMGDYFNCIRYCEFATSYSDRNAAVFGLLGQALMRNPDYRWQKRAENALLRAAELEPFNPGHFVALGHFYESHGL